MNFQWSKYQSDIFDFVQNGQGHGAGVACAGSAKTTTAVESMQKIDLFNQVLFTTFAKKIATELRNRVSHLDNCTVGTYNSIGWVTCLKQMRTKPNFDNDKTDHILKYKVLNNEDEPRYYRSRSSIIKLVSLLKGENCQTLDKANQLLSELINNHGISVPQEHGYIPLLFDTYERCINDSLIFDFDDQKFMPLKLGLQFEKFDFVIVDEYQDTNVLEEALVKACTGNDTRMLIVGDPDQSIYSFRGAREDTIDRFIKEKEAKMLPLYICYRCPKAVVNEAKKIVPHIEAAPNAIDGVVDKIKKDRFRKMAQSGDMILCRTTAPLVKYCLEDIRQGKQAYVEGKEIGKDLINQIELIPGGDDPSMLIDYWKDVFNQYVNEKCTDWARFGKTTLINAVRDKAETINVLMEGTTTISELKSKVAEIFKEAGIGIRYMTIHKSKGLEGGKDNDVYIIRPDLLPFPKGKPAEEKRLEYVADTRTRRGLYFVEKDSDER